MRAIRRIFVHCTATPEGRDHTAEDIRRWHRARGWSDIGYHSVIRLNGVEELGRDPDGDGDVAEHVGAHAYGHNADSLAVVYVGGTDRDGKAKDTRTPAQKRALVRRVVHWMRMYGVPLSGVLGHYEVDPGKACPSFDMGPFRAELARVLKDGLPDDVRPAPGAEWPSDLMDQGLPLLQIGDKGLGVLAVRVMLLGQGYPAGTAPGRSMIFDLRLDEAVREFQKDAGLAVDGRVGRSQTWPALCRETFDAAPARTQRMTPEDLA